MDIIKCLQKNGLVYKDIHEKFVTSLADNAPALSTVQKWATRFRMGRENPENDQRTGHPQAENMEEKVDCVWHMMIGYKSNSQFY